MNYIPHVQILNAYANLMINFALGEGKGVKPGDVVFAEAADFAMPILAALQREILKAGAFPFIRIMPSGMETDVLELANEAQLTFFPEPLWKGLFDAVDHRVYFKPYELLRAYASYDPAKVIRRQNALLKPRVIQNAKENSGMLTWALAWYGTDGYAEEVGMTPFEYWEQIIQACFLTDPDPVKTWKQITAGNKKVAQKLTDMQIKRLHILGEGTDLWVTVGDRRVWKTGSGHNVPSVEIFTSPDKRGTHGTVRFNQPLYLNGIRVSGISLTFDDGKIVQATAEENEEVLLALIAEPAANMLGEISLTDARVSTISRPMACALYDENMMGNMHMAVGASYRDTFDGKPTDLDTTLQESLGFNDPDAQTHVDIVTTLPRMVEAFTGSTNKNPKVIYRENIYTI